ncbi:uncharacterized protein GGS25DRAFT_527129 [Hypoxylon fragiforme]|uniref:uncharacterized protein n=1 Tax=Hypoxylon fragiforme TaxID=63214 RepID=UPI0020C5F507|nr:uncharacterized protein GGS25DRAFT_527129 [Hypoxylon fragiforme]KAI2614016.1 hypothetical protein GGS25DRAFT_527129 [Hypoxylon fragiforme]
MSSTQFQSRNQDGSSIMKGHQHRTSQSESTRAYDSLQEHLGANMGRSATYDPQPENNGTGIGGALSRWLGKYRGKSPSPERPSISKPQRIGAPQAPLRSNRVSLEPTPSLMPGSRILPELEIPMSVSSLPRLTSTRRRSLASKNDALGSHPVRWLDNMEGRFPAQKILLRPGDEGHGRTVDAPSKAGRSRRVVLDPGMEINPEVIQLKAIKAERRKGRLFLPREIPTNFSEFPDPEAWHVDTDDRDRMWEDAGFDDVEEYEIPDDEIPGYEIPGNEIPASDIPDIIVTAPDDEPALQNNDASEDLLVVDDCYKHLWNKQRREIRDLKCSLQFLLPLATLVAEAEEIDLNDITALETALKTIIQDRDRLFDLYPLAQALAKDQKLDENDFKALPQALRNVLADRDNAKRVAHYHRTMRQRLEVRVAELEMKKEKGSDVDSQDEEEYMWL